MKTLKSPVIYNASRSFELMDKPLYLAGIFNMSKEIWKPVVGFEGYYEVSSMGRVRSLDMIIKTKSGSKTFKKGRIRSTKCAKGAKYEHLLLAIDGKKFTKKSSCVSR
jgi:hypothetical protein